MTAIWESGQVLDLREHIRVRAGYVHDVTQNYAEFLREPLHIVRPFFVGHFSAELTRYLTKYDKNIEKGWFELKTKARFDLDTLKNPVSCR